MFYLIIRWRARVPAQNSFAARRIHGPGLSRQAFFQIDPDLALVALQVIFIFYIYIYLILIEGENGN
jgi:hypothetical protein